MHVDPASKLPAVDLDVPAPDGPASCCPRSDPRVRRAGCASSTGVAVTDTTFRDAHQSLLATRVRTRDLLPSRRTSPGSPRSCSSLEAWGGATYDVALRFLAEDPWDRLAALREAVPNICLQMLLRGRNTVGYTPYPTEVTDAFVAEAAATGIDIFRIFDALNDVEQMRPAIDAVRATGTTVAEVALCYTGDLSDPAEKLYTLDYYLRLAERIVDAGAHVLAIKDMAGLLRAPAARTPGHRAARASSTCRCTCTPTTPPAASSPPSSPRSTPASTRSTRRRAAMAGTTSQPSLSALVAATDHSDARHRPRPARRSCDLEPYWEAVRRLYAPFESGLPHPPAASTATRSPAASSPTCASRRSRSASATSSSRSRTCTPPPNAILGNVVKVTPSSKVVGDLALHLVGGRARTRRSSRPTPASSTSPTRSSASCAASSATRPAAGPSRSAPRPSQGAPAAARPSELTDEQRDGLATDRPRATLNRAALPRARPRSSRESPRDLRRHLGAADQDFLYGLRRARSTRWTSSRGQDGCCSGCRRSASPTSVACAR